MNRGANRYCSLQQQPRRGLIVAEIGFRDI